MKRPIDFLSILRKYEIIIASVVIIIVILILTYFILLPNFVAAKNISDQQNLLQKRLTALQKKDKALSELNYQYYKDNFPKLSRILPESKDFISLFDRFDVLQSKTQVIVAKTDFQLGVVSTSAADLARAPGMNAVVIPMTFEVSGNTSSIKQFIESLTDLSGRLITTDSIRLIFKEENLIQANFAGRAYFYPLPTVIGGIDAPLAKLDDKSSEVLAKIAQTSPSGMEEEKVILPVGKKDLFN